MKFYSLKSFCCLFVFLMKGRIPYTKPILSWLSQDQHYGEGFYSVQVWSLSRSNTHAANFDVPLSH